MNLMARDGGRGFGANGTVVKRPIDDRSVVLHEMQK